MDPLADEEAKVSGGVGGTGQHMESIVPFAKAVKLYQQKNRNCFRCGSPSHLVWDCPKHEQICMESGFKHQRGDGKEGRLGPSDASCCSANIPIRSPLSIKTL